MESQKQPKKKMPAGFALCIGVAIGCCIGVIMKTITGSAATLGIGISTGIVIGVILEANNKKQAEK